MSYTIWFTGLSSAGKTTVAEHLAEKIRSRSKELVMLDGDVLRKILSPELGYTKEERDKQVIRVARVCKLITKSRVINIACIISATRKIREYVRSIIGEDEFLEVYVKCPVEICEQRDVKGYYSKARRGEIKDFVGITIKYEEPDNPDLVLETDKETVEESTDKIIKLLEKKGFLK